MVGRMGLGIREIFPPTGGSTSHHLALRDGKGWLSNVAEKVFIHHRTKQLMDQIWNLLVSGQQEDQNPRFCSSPYLTAGTDPYGASSPAPVKEGWGGD